MKAFPLTNTNTQHTGMDLRDYFAAKAMQAMIANPDCPLCPLTIIPKAAYEIADAMMEARKS